MHTVTGTLCARDTAVNEANLHTCPRVMGEINNKQISKNIDFVNGGNGCVEQ